MVVHRLAYQHAANLPTIADDTDDDFPKGQHADQVTMLHDHQRADVFFGHDVCGFGQRLIRLNGIKGAAFNAQYVGYFHGDLLYVDVVIFPPQDALWEASKQYSPQ